jgi:hypothetical protein
MGRLKKLSEFHREELIKQWRKGATVEFLASENEISVGTARKYIKQSGKKRYAKRKSKARGMNDIPANNVKAFLSSCRKAIHRSEPGGVAYKRWAKIVEEFETDGGMTHQEACIQASKEFPCCKKLFAAYAPALEGKDPIPESNPDLYTGQQADDSEGMKCEDRELSYRENLDWAIEAAGKEKNEGEAPKVCPNHTAFYLYREARDNSKEFLSRFTQVVGRGVDEADEQRKARRGGERSIDEINEMLDTLTPGEENGK